MHFLPRLTEKRKLNCDLVGEIVRIACVLSKFQREFTSPAAYGEIAKVEAALCQADQRRREADHALLTSLSRQQRTTTAETEKPAWSDPNFLSDL